MTRTEKKIELNDFNIKDWSIWEQMDQIEWT